MKKKLLYDNIKLGGLVHLSWPYTGSKGIISGITNYSDMGIDEPIFHVKLGEVSFYYGLKYIQKHYIN